jgi:hypothetical protein
MIPLIVVVFYLVAILALCAFAVSEALSPRKRPEVEEEEEIFPIEATVPEIPEEEKHISEMSKAINLLASGLFPAGCKFYQDNGELSSAGELLAAIMADKRVKTGEVVSPCKGCSYYKECATEGRFQPKANRLDTDDLEVRRMTHEEMAMTVNILMSPLNDDKDWAFDPDNPVGTNARGDDSEIPFIGRVIRKRILGEKLKIAITQKAYFIIIVLTDGNPGKAMFILHKIGNLLEKGRTPDWLVTSGVVMSALFPFGVPTEEAWDKWWDEQKVPTNSGRSWSDNLVDVFPEEWKKK